MKIDSNEVDFGTRINAPSLPSRGAALVFAAVLALGAVRCLPAETPTAAAPASPSTSTSDVETLRREKQSADEQQRAADRKLQLAELDREVVEVKTELSKAAGGSDQEHVRQLEQRHSRLLADKTWKQGHWQTEDALEAARGANDEKKVAELEAKLERSGLQHELEAMQSELTDARNKVKELEKQTAEMQAKLAKMPQ